MKNPQSITATDMGNDFNAALLPTLSVRNGAAAVEFYKKAFSAEVSFYLTDPDGDVVAELSIKGVRFLVADESPEHENFSPETLGGSTIRMGLVVPDPDAVAKQAIAAGAQEIYPVADQDYGYRLGRIKDPFGHHWEICRKLWKSQESRVRSQGRNIDG